jgi:uncharacterized membrane protein
MIKTIGVFEIGFVVMLRMTVYLACRMIAGIDNLNDKVAEQG